MSLVQKYKNGILSAKEKKQFLKICFVLELEDFQDWLSDLKISKKVKSGLVEITNSHDTFISFCRLLDSNYAPMGWVYDVDYKAIFKDEKETIKYDKLLSNLGVTVPKIDDLLVSLSFNTPNDVFDVIDEENIIARYDDILISKSADNFYIAD